VKRLLPLLILAALALAPFGRIGAAEASSRHQSAMQMPGHCAGESAPADERDAGAGIDCMIACAGVASAAAPFLAPMPLAEPVPHAPVPLTATGIRPEFEPPPPRLS
jgi:hypothetical protein